MRAMGLILVREKRALDLIPRLVQNLRGRVIQQLLQAMRWKANYTSALLQPMRMN